MAGILGGLLGGGGSDPMDIYGDLFTEKQRAALRDQQMTQGLLNAAAVFSKAGQASRLPVSIPWGEAAQALGGSGDEAMNRMLKGMQVAEEVRGSRQTREWQTKLNQMLMPIWQKQMAMGQPLNPSPASVGAPDPRRGGTPANNAPPPPPAYQNPDMGDVPARPMATPTATDTGDYLPGKGAGLLAAPPLIDEANRNPYNSGPLSTEQQLALQQQWPGLLGGGPTAPPFGQGSQGSPDRRIQIEQLSGMALPVDAPFPTVANPNKPASAWQQGTRYDRGEVPFDHARPYATPQQFAAPPSDLDRLSQLMKVETVTAPSNLTGSAWEIANNNFGGMRRPGVNATPSQGGFQTFATPEAGLGAISNQLDRYASGATTGKPLSTIREIVSTWAPPSENDTEALIKRASRVMGVADNIPLNLSDPAVKAKLIEATVRNEQGGRLPVDPALIGQVANAPPGTYAASTGSSGRGFSGRIEPLGGSDAVPAGAAPSGTIPGLGMTPEALATLNALMKVNKLGSPFDSLLETYYKSPGYLAEKARTEEQAKKDIELKMDPLILEQRKRTEYKVDTELKPALEAAVATAMNAPLKLRAQAQADIARLTEQLKQAGVAGTNIQEATILGDDNKPILKKMSALEIATRERLTEERRKAGDLVPRPGDIVGTPVLTPEQTAAQTQRGKTGEEMREVQVWTPTGLVTQQMTNLEIEARRKLAADRGVSGSPQIGDIVDKPAMNSADQKIADALGEDFIALRRQAIAADKTIRDTHNLRSKIDSGMFTGLDANLNLFLARLGDTMGWKNLSDADKIKNTQTYIAGLGSEVLAMVKDLKPASNVDLQFASQMAGSQNLSAASIRQLLDMREEYARLAIQRHNDEAAGRNPAIFQGARRELPMPPAYQPKELTTPGGNKVIINR